MSSLLWFSLCEPILVVIKPAGQESVFFTYDPKEPGASLALLFKRPVALNQALLVADKLFVKQPGHTQQNRQQIAWLPSGHLKLMSGRVVDPKTKFVHCSDCLQESLLKKKRFSRSYGYVCPDKACPGSKRFDLRTAPIPWANQQGFKARLRSFMISDQGLELGAVL